MYQVLDLRHCGTHPRDSTRDAGSRSGCARAPVAGGLGPRGRRRRIATPIGGLRLRGGVGRVGRSRGGLGRCRGGWLGRRRGGLRGTKKLSASKNFWWDCC
ncbi:uncharacterized protein BO95DRAFT_16324 [Aspergillus brunneoviolaceus CBS 621.78]|uniref:Uncharacterized protein n=1 Tax=Aspergillus brunneoviolaceus CBS 621.78 TaxID=1450534 RepID=A0ACD1FTX9_9EURO|nr:hypothetical protein BO95DRAFT_16324 [Aspergillus brunneoviolaceus CBS 621.78]RAH40409.1 hypothetical protein BO95DRAFT_16324 [Aspergillus brunneoviolaceus CBS 621.78]